MRLQTIEDLNKVKLWDENKRLLYKTAIDAGYEPRCIGNGVLWPKPESDRWGYECILFKNWWVNIFTNKCTIWSSVHVGWKGKSGPDAWKAVYKQNHELEEGWVKVENLAIVGTRPHSFFKAVWHDEFEPPEMIEVPETMIDSEFTPNDDLYFNSYKIMIDANHGIVLAVEEEQIRIIKKFFDPDVSGIGVASAAMPTGHLAASLMERHD